MKTNPVDCPESMKNAKKLVQLGCLQTKAAIIDSETQLNRLSGHFTELVEVERNITQNLENNLSVTALILQLRQLINSATVEFQFFDRLKQKLEHAVAPLESWTELGVLSNPGEESFANRYTTPEERELYNLLMKTGSIKDALSKLSPNDSNHETNDIELF